MIQLRKDNPVFVYGDYKVLQPEHPDIYACIRKMDNKEMLVLLNFGSKNSNIQLREASSIKKSLIDNYESVKIEDGTISLQPYQAVIFSLD
jgi:oligo-1,6-glucosidase